MCKGEKEKNQFADDEWFDSNWGIKRGRRRPKITLVELVKTRNVN